MGPVSYDDEIRQLWAKVGRLRERAAHPEEQSHVTLEALEDLSNALEELRVSSEELNRQYEDLKLAHLELERERLKYQDLFQSAPDGYIVTDLEGLVIEANQAAQVLLNVRARTLIGQPLAIRIVGTDVAQYVKMAKADSPDVLAQELRLRRRGCPPFLARVARTFVRDAAGPVVGHRWSIQDLTTLKQTEEHLRINEGLLRSLVDGAKDFAIIRLDLLGCIASWNNGAERIFGYETSEVLGRPFEMLRAPGDQSTSEEQLQVLAERYGRAEVEGWRVHKNGKQMWTNSVLTPLRDAGGRLTGFARVLRDVTERRRTEEALAERSRFSQLQAEVGIALTEGMEVGPLLERCASATLLNLGAALVRIWTIREDEDEDEDADEDEEEDELVLHLRACAGDNQLRDDLPAEVPIGSPLEVARVARRQEPYVTGEVLSERNLTCKEWARRNGITWYAGVPLRLDGELVGVLEVFAVHALGGVAEQSLDTLARSLALGLERMRAEAKLSRALLELEQTMETVPEAIFTLNNQGRLERWNRKLEQAARLPRLGGARLADLVPEAENALVEEALAKAFSSGQVEWEGHILRADGTAAPVSWALATRKDTHGRIVGLTGSGRDITERREGEIRLAQLSRRLLHLREEEQRRISRELHDSTAQNLAALCISISGLAGLSGRLDPGSQRLVREAGDLAERCLREVRTISYLLHPPLLDEVGLPAALRWFVKGFSTRSGVKTRVNLPSDLGRLDSDLEIAIFRIVQESLTNVHRHAQARSVVVGLRRTRSSIVIEIADNGRGIAAILNTVAATGAGRGQARRARRKPASRPEVDWMGLGLTGIRERVQERGGHFEVESGAKGTTVSVELPIQERAVS